MTQDDFYGWLMLAAIVAVIWLGSRWFTTRESRRTLTDEIMNRNGDAEALYRANVEAGGDRDATRKAYIGARMKVHRKSHAKRVLGFAWGLVGIFMIGSVIYSCYVSYFTTG